MNKPTGFSETMTEIHGDFTFSEETKRASLSEIAFAFSWTKRTFSFKRAISADQFKFNLFCTLKFVHFLKQFPTEVSQIVVSQGTEFLQYFLICCCNMDMHNKV